MSVRCSLRVLFEDPFWIGVYEHWDEGKYQACKVTFGAEPKDFEVSAYMLANWKALPMSQPVSAPVETERRVNPKRMRREIKASLCERGIGTKAQQAIRLQREENKLLRRERTREQRKEERARRFALRQEKKRERHRGH